MATVTSLIASDIATAVAVLMNNAAADVYSLAVVLPYLNIALQELQEEYEDNRVPVTSAASAVISIPANTTRIAFTPAVTPNLPDDFIEPTLLWERPSGIDPYIPMTRLSTLSLYLSGTQIPQLLYYVWESQEIRFLPANAANDVKMNYVRNLFVPITAGATGITLINARTWLEFRTAGLCAEFIGENETRAASLNNNAAAALDRALGITTKGRQSISTRRRPFRAGFKSRVL